MENIADYFNKENSHKIFRCIVDGEEVLLQCYYDIDFKMVEAYSWENPNDSEGYISEIQEVVCELVFKDGGDEGVCTPTKEDQAFVDSLLIQDDVYSYNTNYDLQNLIRILGVQVVSGDQDSEKGLLFYYSEYDDFDCYGDGWTHYAKIINNAIVLEK